MIEKLRHYIVSQYRCLLKHFPKKYADVLYFDLFGVKINWKNPVTFNEKINCLEFSRYSRN